MLKPKLYPVEVGTEAIVFVNLHTDWKRGQGFKVGTVISLTEEIVTVRVDGKTIEVPEHQVIGVK